MNEQPGETFNSESGTGHQPADVIEAVFERASRAASAGATISPVQQIGDTSIVVLSEVMMGGGFGFGGGGSAGDDKSPAGFGSGGGGGVGAQSRPVAIVYAGPSGVRVKPIVDISKLTLAGVGAAGFLAFWLIRLMREAKGQPPRPQEAGRFFGRMMK